MPPLEPTPNPDPTSTPTAPWDTFARAAPAPAATTERLGLTRPVAGVVATQTVLDQGQRSEEAAPGAEQARQSAPEEVAVAADTALETQIPKLRSPQSWLQG